MQYVCGAFYLKVSSEEFRAKSYLFKKTMYTILKQTVNLSKHIMINFVLAILTVFSI